MRGEHRFDLSVRRREFLDGRTANGALVAVAEVRPQPRGTVCGLDGPELDLLLVPVLDRLLAPGFGLRHLVAKRVESRHLRVVIPA